jgi:fatty acid/phospholipid biosynthesis enzyme
MGLKRINPSSPAKKPAQLTIESMWKKPNQSKSPLKLLADHPTNDSRNSAIASDMASISSHKTAESISDGKPSARPSKDSKDCSNSSATKKIENLQLCSDGSSGPTGAAILVTTLDTGSLIEISATASQASLLPTPSGSDFCPGYFNINK